VVNVLDLETWTSTNTGLAGTPLAPGRTLVGWPVYEADQGQQDLNGDGDATDRVWHVHDLATGQTTNLQLAATGGDNKLIGRDFFVLRAFEAYSGGTDFNGDGDHSDPAILVFDARTGSLTNLMLAATDIGELQGRRIVFTVGEMATGMNGTDLNGDGDAFDHVIYVFDIP